MDAIRLQADHQFAQMRHNSNPTAETAEKLAQAKEAYERALNAEKADKIDIELFSPEHEDKLEDTDRAADRENDDEQEGEKKSPKKKRERTAAR